MKKISFVLIALLALVAFTGCPTMHDDLKTEAESITVEELEWPPASIPEDTFAVKVSGLSYSNGVKEWNSNISWGGATGSWAGDNLTLGTTAISVTVINGEGIMYLSTDYAASGWALAEAKTGTNFKLATGDGADKWFNIAVPGEGANQYIEIVWTAGIE